MAETTQKITSDELTILEARVVALLRTMEPYDVIEIRRKVGAEVEVLVKSTVKESFLLFHREGMAS